MRPIFSRVQCAKCVHCVVWGWQELAVAVLLVRVELGKPVLLPLPQCVSLPR